MNDTICEFCSKETPLDETYTCPDCALDPLCGLCLHDHDCESPKP